MKKPLLLAAALALLAFPALAQSVTADVPATWWSELVAAITSSLQPAALTILTALGGYALTRVSSWLTGKISDQARDRVISGAQNAGKVALASLIASAADGKITLADILAAARIGGANLLDTYAESAAKLKMTQANAESVVKGAIMTAAADAGLSVDLEKAGAVISMAPDVKAIASDETVREMVRAGVNAGLSVSNTP